MKFSQLTEGKVSFFAPVANVITKELPVFYNPVMSLNRDIAVLLVESLGNKKLVVADPLAGTGIRALRFLKELPKGTVAELRVNDGNPKFPELFKKNLKLNGLDSANVIIERREASQFLIEGSGVDYVDIDPFGSPNPFLDAACKKLSRDGVLAVTATDTGALAGSFPDACRRKYWAEPARNECMHETGIRILIRKIQLIGMQYDRALVPIFSHATDHYVRVYLHAEKSKVYIKRLMDHHGFILFCPSCLERAVSAVNAGVCSCGTEMQAAGPLWLGSLWNHQLVQAMLPKTSGAAKKLLERIHQESHIPIVGFFDIHRICKLLKIVVPKTERIIEELKKRKYTVGLTHFSDTGIRTDAPLEEVKKVIQLVAKQQQS